MEQNEAINDTIQPDTGAGIFCASIYAKILCSRVSLHSSFLYSNNIVCDWQRHDQNTSHFETWGGSFFIFHVIIEIIIRLTDFACCDWSIPGP